jgi:predicted ATPase/class 3 adenylate cyclase
MKTLPEGTVTLLFTDIEGSTSLLESSGDSYPHLLARHHELVEEAIAASAGQVVNTAGDSFFAAFPTAEAAVTAAVEAQRRLLAEPWPENRRVLVRMGLHSGAPRRIDSGYVGLDVHRAARIMAAAHGGQILVSETTASLLGVAVALRDLGEHRLKDLSLPQRLYQVLAPGMREEFPAVRTLENRPMNLPVQRNALLGREAELATLGAMLGSTDVRVVTVTGTGGVGKTRLTLEIAAELIDQFRQGVYFVSLAVVRDPDLVLPTIAQTLGLSDDGAEPVSVRLSAALAGKQVLLVLDNFEQVIAAGPAVVAACCAAPGVKLLVSSRSSLRVAGERVLPLAPLVVPDASDENFSALAASPAIALFAQRAHAARADFELSEANTAAVAELCARLDGLPLAIELAASRIGMLPPQAILARLDQRFRLLTGGPRDATDRQQTLRATLDWSYDLLSAAEQALLARMSVFAAGGRLDHIEAVCDHDGELGLDTFEGVAALTERSLLRSHEDFDGEPRFWMLETIRVYAAERLCERVDRDITIEAFIDRYAAFAASAQPHWRDADAGTWIPTFASEIGNVRAAIAYLEERGRPADALQLACDLGWLWETGYAREGAALLARLRVATPKEERDLHAYAAAMQLIAIRGRSKLDPKEVQEVSAACMAAGHADIATLARLMLAHQLVMEDRIEEAAALVEAAEEMAAEYGDEGVEAWTVGARADVYRFRGQPDAARTFLEGQLTRPYYRQNTNHLINVLIALGELEVDQERLEAAHAAAERALALVRQTDDQLAFCGALILGGQVELLRGHAGAADALLAEAEEHELNEIAPGGTSPDLEDIRLLRAAATAARGDTAAGRAAHDRAANALEASGHSIQPATQKIVSRILGTP